MYKTVLWLEGTLAMGLVAGAVLARLRRFRFHGWLQGVIVTGNALVIAVVMIPSFYRYLPSRTPDTRVVLVHAIAGSVAELLGLYIVISAGLGWLPPRLRFSNYKPWMRLALVTWLVAFGLGVWTYRALNGGSVLPAPPVSTPGATSSSASNVRIVVKNFGFDPAELTVPAGTEVEWTDEGGRHNVQADDGSFKSEIMTQGGTFTHRFDQPGSYRYFCEFHGSAGGHDMAGVVNVR
jgi:plastocyanin